MTAATDFIANPTGFMRGNIVFATGMSAADPAAAESLYWVTLAAGWAPTPTPPYDGKPANGVLQRGGTACSVYFLRSLGLCVAGAAQPADSFAVYWVPYEQNDTTLTNIGTRSRIIFTAKMDGCSFGLGSVNPDGSCIAGHANRVDVGRAAGFMAQTAAQSAGLTARGLTRQLGPETYRTARADATGRQIGWTDQGTTFGVREATGWKIYAQRIGGTAPNFVHKGLVTGITAQL
jgi:hypothetical protein